MASPAHSPEKSSKGKLPVKGVQRSVDHLEFYVVHLALLLAFGVVVVGAVGVSLIVSVSPLQKQRVGWCAVLPLDEQPGRKSPTGKLPCRI